jgi:hypothetical protein
MISSSFSNTITIQNFKSLSQTVIEFWKRYHQKPVSGNFRELRGGPKVVSYEVVFLLILLSDGPQRLPHTILKKCGFSALFFKIPAIWMIPSN